MISFVSISQVIGRAGWMFCSRLEIGSGRFIWNDLWCFELDARPY